MINFEDIKKVIDDLEKYVSNLKTVTETQSELEKSGNRLQEIKKELDSLLKDLHFSIDEIRNFADIAQQAEQMRNDILSENFTNIKDRITGIEIQNNNRINDLEKMLLNIDKSISNRNKVLIFIMLTAALLTMGITFWEKFL